MEVKIGKTITFVDGMYSYDDIDQYIKKYMKNKGHLVEGTKDSKEDKIKYGINCILFYPLIE